MELEVTTEDGTKHTVETRKVGGRGEAGNMNWGVSGGEPKAEAEQKADALRKHVGNVLILTGGGGFGWELVRLNDVRVEEYEDGYKPRVTLTMLYGTRTGRELSHFDHGSEFTPWIDSWQLSVPEPSEPVEEFADAIPV